MRVVLKHDHPRVKTKNANSIGATIADDDAAEPITLEKLIEQSYGGKPGGMPRPPESRGTDVATKDEISPAFMVPPPLWQGIHTHQRMAAAAADVPAA